MKMIRNITLLVLLAFIVQPAFSQAYNRNIKTPEYNRLQDSICTGWNTWYNNSMMTHALLPEGFAINLCISRNGYWGNSVLRNVFKRNNNDQEVFPGLRSDDGSYTSMKIRYKGELIQVQSATDGDDIVFLVTPIENNVHNQLVVEAGILWSKEGNIGKVNNGLTGDFPSRKIRIGTTGVIVESAYVETSNPYFVVPLNNEFGIYSGKTRTLPEIKKIIERNRAEQQRRVDSYGDLSEQFLAMQTVLAWNTIYDAPNNRAISPVSRIWSQDRAGYVLFDWDTYFACYMLALYNKGLAYSNAIEMTKAITPGGFIPNYQSPYGRVSWDRSQPPIGSTIILQIYKRYKEKWFLQEVYDELLTWNRWWAKSRDIDGYLAWGSTPYPDSIMTEEMKSKDIHNMQAAKFESGLDNSPMYDDIIFNEEKNVMELADVGLMSLYIMDCHSVAEIARVLGKTNDAREIEKRAKKYTEKLSELWSKEDGIFLNKNLVTGKFSHRISPTNFYPMLANACTQKQAETMIEKHYFNPDEFYGDYVMPSIAKNDPAFPDNDYWRGRIWGPMNFLVYMGMCQYNLPKAKKDLVEKSDKLLITSWRSENSVYEHFNSLTGLGDGHRGDNFYHWGALMSFMSFIEKGYMPKPLTE